jgi:hypothetical protein
MAARQRLGGATVPLVRLLGPDSHVVVFFLCKPFSGLVVI